MSDKTTAAIAAEQQTAAAEAPAESTLPGLAGRLPSPSTSWSRSTSAPWSRASAPLPYH